MVEHDSTLLVVPTGCDKTAVFSAASQDIASDGAEASSIAAAVAAAGREIEVHGQDLELL